MYTFLSGLGFYLGNLAALSIFALAYVWDKHREYLNEAKTIVVVVIVICAIYSIVMWVWDKRISFANEAKDKLEAEEHKQWNKARARDREQWEEQLHREITREEALARVRNTSMIEMYKTQVDLMMKYKKEGANIDKDIFAMREKLLVLEGQENKAMVQDLMNTLNGL